MSSLTAMAKRFYPYAQDYLGFDKPVTIEYQSDPKNAQNPLGNTAHYEPSNYKVTLYVDGRHPKDLLRSLAHELVHHTQNCRGDLTPEKMGETGPGYAQSNTYMRGMEREAYEKGNLCMRDWEDQYKTQKENLHLQEQNKMEFNENVAKILMEKIQAEIRAVAEGSGDRNDGPREQGHGEQRQRPGSAGNAGKNEEVDNDEDVVAEADHGDDDDDKKDGETVEEGGMAYKVDDNEDGQGDDDNKDDKEETVEEGGMAYKVDDDEDAQPANDKSDDDEGDEANESLEDMFDSRNGQLMERLIKNWATK